MPLVCAIHRSSSATSCAVSQRSSGAFARHFFTTRSSAGGVSGCSVARGRRNTVIDPASGSTIQYSRTPSRS